MAKQPPQTTEPGAAGEGAQLEDPMQQFQVTAAQSYEKLTQTAAQLTDQAHDLYETSQAAVRDNPAPFALGAFGVGLLLGFLFARD